MSTHGDGESDGRGQPGAAAGTLPVVLVVDDDPDVVQTLSRLLGGGAWRLVTLSNAREAARFIRQHPVDLLISDVDMPGMSGHDLVKLARELRPSAVRILCTGVTSMESVMQAINEGEVHRYITKPFVGRALRALVENALVRREELRRATEAAQRAEKRGALLAQLEAEHPGITEVARDDGGAYLLDDAAAAAAAADLSLSAFLRDADHAVVPWPHR
jgi:DNA-binding NtrC family response regulator